MASAITFIQPSSIAVQSPHVTYSNDCMEAQYEYATTRVVNVDGAITVKPETVS